MYEVTYKTKVKPIDLPEGAEVKEVSILPLTITPNPREEVTLYQDGSVYVVDQDGCQAGLRRLPKDKARQLIDGLLEYIGEPSLDELKGSGPDRPIQVGDTVRILAGHYKGYTGVIEYWNEEKADFHVRLPRAKVIFVEPHNLEHA